MSLRVWSRRSRTVAVTGLLTFSAGLTWLTLWLLGKGTDGAGIANVLALPLTALGTVAAAYGLRSRPRADDPAVLLARARTALGQIITLESRTLQRLVGDTGDTKTADIGFAQPDPTDVRWRTDGGPDNGSSVTISAFYHSLQRGRLVILGEPGAGKSVLAIRLLLDLATAEHQKSVAAPAGSAVRIQVPLHLSLSAFPWLTTDHTAVEVRSHLDKWMADHLSSVHGLEVPVAHELVSNGWVLPILDGLDEMDSDDAEPRRAQTVLAALNLPAGPGRWPVVLTSRIDRYGHLANNTTPTQGVLQDATVVTMRPLTTGQIIDWLTYRFPAPEQPLHIQPRWRPVITRIRRNPSGRLATCLASPLHLYLATSAYQQPDGAPRTLCHLDTVALNEHLFDRLIPAIAANHPRANGDHYAAGDVERWLRTFAGHLAWMGAHQHSGIDLHLHQLWQSGKGWRSIRRRPALSVVIALVALMAVLTVAIELTGVDTDSQNWGKWLAFLTTVGIGTQRILFNNSGTWQLRRLEPRRVLTPAGTRALTWGLTVGIASGLVFGFAAGDLIGLSAGLALGLGAGVALGFTRGLAAGPLTARQPSDPVRQAIVHDLTFPVIFTLVSMVVSGPAVSIVFGVTITLMMAVASPWPRYAVAVLTFVRHDDLPARPAQFLDWAYAAGLVRMAGIAVQFRHRDLQSRLTPSPSHNLQNTNLAEAPISD